MVADEPAFHIGVIVMGGASREAAMIGSRENSKLPELKTQDAATPEPGPDAEQGIVNDDAVKIVMASTGPICL